MLVGSHAVHKKILQPASAGTAYHLSSMLHGSLIEVAPVIICQLLLHGADIKVGAVSPLLGQHGAVMSILGHMSYHLLQVSGEEPSLRAAKHYTRPFLSMVRTATAIDCLCSKILHVKLTSISPQSTELPDAYLVHVQLQDPAQ